MASQTKNPTPEPLEQDTPALADELQAEALNEPSPHLALLKPAGSIRNSDRLRFMARARNLESTFKDLDGDVDLASIPAESLDSIADFTEWVTDRFAVSGEASAQLEQIPLGEYIELVFEYLGDLGESMGSSN
jgi:hypothetical protein